MEIRTTFRPIRKCPQNHNAVHLQSYYYSNYEKIFCFFAIDSNVLLCYGTNSYFHRS